MTIQSSKLKNCLMDGATVSVFTAAANEFIASVESTSTLRRDDKVAVIYKARSLVFEARDLISSRMLAGVDGFRRAVTGHEHLMADVERHRYRNHPDRAVEALCAAIDKFTAKVA